MIFVVLEYLIYLILLCGLCIKFCDFETSKRNGKSLVNIPGPKGYPIIGNTLKVIQKNPEELFMLMQQTSQKYFPIFKLIVGFKTTVVLTNPEDIELVLSNAVHTANTFSICHNWLGTGMLTNEVNKWNKRRQLIFPILQSNIILDFIKIFNEETKHLVEIIRKNAVKEIDIVPLASEFSLITINEAVIGTKLKLRDEYTQKYKLAIKRMGQLLLARQCNIFLHNQYIYDLTKSGREEKELIAALQDATKHAIIERQKDYKRQEVTKKKLDANYCNKRRLSVLDFLFGAKTNNDINLDGVAEELNTLMFAGHDTVTSALSCTLFCLAHNPDVQAKIVKEMQREIIDSKTNPTLNDLQKLKYTERTIKETLRLYPSIPIISRTLKEEITTYTGYDIPKNTTIAINIFGMHTHPNFYPDPKEFDSDRFLPEKVAVRHKYAYLPFSCGPRSCIGEKFAFLEIKAALVGILNEFVVKPAKGMDNLGFLSDQVLRTNRNGVIIKFVPRNK